MQYSVKYRPATFAQVVGQHVTCRILVNSILMDRVPAAILFAGTRGTGKTTLARLYARALNCENFQSARDLCGTCPSCREAADSHLSILERDAASYNGVDDVRDLAGILHQTVIHKYRVLILDECHMLSKQAQAALLKQVEEPPSQTVFLLASTDPQKVEDTLRSRCLSAPLRVLNSKEVADNMKMILNSEGRQYTEDFVQHLSLLGGGSLRDVQQILESMVLAAGDGIVDANLLRDSVGVISKDEYGQLAEMLDRKDLRLFLENIRRWHSEGWDLPQLFMEGIPVLLRDFSMFLAGVRPEDVECLSGLTFDSFSRNLRLGLSDVDRLVREWEVTVEFMKMTPNPMVLWSMFAVKACECGK
jgi:DNA polymerase-3 subunit gamma/tau